MKKSSQSKLLVLLTGVLLLFACKQEKEVQPTTSGNVELTVMEAQQWVENNLADDDNDQKINYPSKRKVLWKYADQQKVNGHEIVVVPLVYEAVQWSVSLSGKDNAADYHLDKSEVQLYILLLSKDKVGQIQAQVIQVMGDLNYLKNQKGILNSHNFSGLLLTHDWNGQFKQGYRYHEGNLVSTLSPLDAKARTDETVCTEITTSYWYTACYTISDGEHCETHFSFSEIAMECIYIGGGGYGGGIPTPSIILGGGGILIPSTSMYIPGQDKTPIDLNSYLNCFSITADASYQVTLYVEEPQPGTGETKNGLNVGHAFIGFQENTSGGTIEQVVGYYPNEMAIGWVSSKMVDNGGSYYSVSATFTVTPDQFIAAINAAKGLPSQQYSIAEHNCTDAAFSVFDAMGIQLPKTATAFPFGSATGHSPGRLGYDLRNSLLPVNTTPGNASGSKGPCL